MDKTRERPLLHIFVLLLDLDGDFDGELVEARDLRVAGMVGRTLTYGRSLVYLESVSVERHGHMKGLSFSLSVKSTEEASAAEAEALLARRQLRGEDKVPSVPGFCIRRAVFAEPLLVRARRHKLARTYGFDWETPGAKDDPLRPFLSFELRGGIRERSGGQPVETSPDSPPGPRLNSSTRSAQQLVAH